MDTLLCVTVTFLQFDFFLQLSRCIPSALTSFGKFLRRLAIFLLDGVIVR